MNIPTEKTDIFIPETLKALNNWCLWKLETREGRTTKVPYSRTGHKASSTNIKTWSPFETIMDYYSMKGNLYSGLGFMIADGLVFVDVDHCRNYDGSLDKRGNDILSAFPGSYVEISQSGAGLHILTRGEVRKCFNNRKSGVEMYNFGRFCAITGNAIQALEPSEEQSGIDFVFNKYSKYYGKPVSRLPIGRSMNTDQWVISHAMGIEGQKGRDFRTLFDGDASAYESSSEADSALCVLLAFWCDRDQGQIDRIFRQSGLYRPKWEREDYRNRTIAHACEHIPESLSEYQTRMNREKARAIAEQCD